LTWFDSARHGEVLPVPRQRQVPPPRLGSHKLTLVPTGSGISPFLPVTTPSSLLGTLSHAVVFVLRLPFFLTFAAAYFLLLQHLPFLPFVARKLLLWLLLTIPLVWWVDLQLDGVKRGALSQQPRSRVPHPRSIIAANFTSPLDALYLAAVFDPIFVASHPSSRKVRRITLWSAICAALSPRAQLLDQAEWEDSQNNTSRGELTDLRALVSAHPDRVIAVFPECGTTNGKGILPLSPCLLTAPAESAIFPLSMRYTPPDVTTPVPGLKGWAGFLWKLLGRPTHCIRVRIAEGVYNTTAASNGVSDRQQVRGDIGEGRGEDEPTPEEQRLLDRIGEALARLGRVKRVGLTLRDKKAFVAAWTKRR
jgi:1-acyl-sn-glycerol-3-phosphate acyltransferase